MPWALVPRLAKRRGVTNNFLQGKKKKHIFVQPAMVEDSVVGRKVFGKHSPLTACFHHVHDSVHYLPKRVFSLAMLRIQDNFSNLPLFISEVS